MKNKTKYILIFSILFFLIALISVATAHEVNAITVSKQNLLDFSGLELNKSENYKNLTKVQLENIKSNEKKINTTNKKINSYNKQLTTKNKQLKTYNTKLKKLNKKIKTKTIKKSILNTKKSIKNLKNKINILKKQTKKEDNTLKTFKNINFTLINMANTNMKEAWKHLDHAEWALDILDNYNLYVAVSFNNDHGEVPYDDRFDYGYYWKYSEAMNNYYSRQPVDFGLFMSGYYVY